MATRVVLLMLIAILSINGMAAQITSDTKDYQTATKRLRIGTDTSRYLTSIAQVISNAATHRQSPTAKAIVDYCNRFVEVIGNPSTGDCIRWDGTKWVPAPAGLSYTGGAGILIAGSTINNTGDLSTINEGRLTVSPDTDSTAIINSNTAGSTPITLKVRGMQIEESGSMITISDTSKIGLGDGNGIYSGSGSLLSTPTIVNLANKELVFGNNYVFDPIAGSPSSGFKVDNRMFKAAFSDGNGNMAAGQISPGETFLQVKSENPVNGQNQGEATLFLSGSNVTFFASDPTGTSSIDVGSGGYLMSYAQDGTKKNGVIVINDTGFELAGYNNMGITFNMLTAPSIFKQSPNHGFRFFTPTTTTLQSNDAQIADIQAIKAVVQVGSGLSKTTSAGSVTLAVDNAALFSSVQFANLGLITGATITPGITLPNSAQGRRIELYRSGIKMRHGSDYTNTSTTITLTVSAALEPFEIYINP